MLLLTLLRHAKTEPGRSGQEDWDRELEPRGRKDAPEIARRLREKELIPTLIVSSPAVRAVATAKLVARELSIPVRNIVHDERLYLASPKVMLEVIRERGKAAPHLMVVGHNPGITEFADQLSAERSLDNMPTCAAYTLELEITDWKELDWGTGMNAEFDYPSRG
jgi:phosphohistidine phosphatase